MANKEEMQGGGLCTGMGEERMTEQEEEEEGCQTDRSRGKVALSSEMYECLFYTKRWGIFRRREEASKQWRISVQSSQIILDCLFPSSLVFSYVLFFVLAQAQGQ